MLLKKASRQIIIEYNSFPSPGSFPIVLVNDSNYSAILEELEACNYLENKTIPYYLEENQISTEYFEKIWSKLKKLNQGKIHKENKENLSVFDGLNILIRLCKGRYEKRVVMYAPDPAYFMENKLEECLTWLEIFNGLLDLFDEKKIFYEKMIDLRKK